MTKKKKYSFVPKKPGENQVNNQWSNSKSSSGWTSPRT